jgi:glutamate/tyrosine decarboxylase-like PLP-dependent enzyme
MDLGAYLDAARAFDEGFRGRWEPVPTAAAATVDEGRLAAAWAEYTGRLQDNYPFFHPRYAGQMLKPPHPVAVAGYLAAMTVNPNNHALDGGPATGAMEKEVVGDLAAMFGLPDATLGHLTSSGTIANLEALWVARQLAPGRAVAHSQDAHYTHARMCEVLGVESVPVAADAAGRMDLDALEAVLASGRVGTVVLTAGTTGLGAVDPIAEALALRDRYGCRLHVDAAYGGFFALLAHDEQGTGLLGRETAARLRAVGDCDSVVVDPHKHGLQPYGCGAVLFRDPSVGRLYRHDSPYTYFTSSELHLGEISLECSRAGAAAAALWLTFQLLPPRPDGLGQVLAAGRRAALNWSELLAASGRLRLYQRPELDIVCYFPVTAPASLAAIDQASARIMAGGMKDPAHPVYLSTLTVEAEAFARRHPGVAADAARARILRSVLMKPESENHTAQLHARIEELAG